MRMDVQKFDGGTVVLGPCPGCQAWQVDYNLTDEMMAEYAFSAADFNQAVETILVDHLVQCEHLQRAIGNNWVSYV